jgi:endonuclease/exonuclease/phosphatase (EEP) superfamily protein YafD
VANLHASAHRPQRAADELERAARTAVDWSGGDPLLLGGDFNVRPREVPSIYERLGADGFSAPTGDALIDHLLVRGLRVVEPPRQLPVERRELTTADGARVRLSDHAVVAATFDVG